MNELEIGVAVAFGAGILSFLSPCVLPLVPSYLSFVSGIGIEDLESGGASARRTAFTHSLFVIILFGLYLLGLRPGLFLQRERRIHLKNKPLGYLGSTLVGVTFGAGWSPCIGPILGGILMFAATREMMTDGIVLLGFYSLGLAVPFLLSSLALSWFLSTFDRFKRYLPWVERASGGLLILVGLLLITGRFTMLAAWATQFTPDWVLERI